MKSESAANRSPELKTPEDIPRFFAEAWNEKDADKLASMFHEKADFINVVGIWWSHRDDIQKAHDYGFRVIFPDSHLNVTKIKTRYLGEHAAVVHARMHLRGQSSHQGQQAGLRRNMFTFVVQKEASEWVCVSAHNTDIIPGKETHISDENSLTPADYRK